MALTVAVTEHFTNGNKRAVRGTIAFDASYPTGGEALTAATLGLSVIDEITFTPTSGFVFEYDHTNATVLAYAQGFVTGSTAAADTTVGSFVEDIAGAETAWRAMDMPVDTTLVLGGLLQVADTTSLAAVTGVRFIAVGV